MKVLNLLVAGIMLQSSFAYADIDSSAKASLQEAYGNIPLYFIQNEGQVDKRVKYYEKGSGHSTFFTKEGVYISLQAPKNPNSAKDRFARSETTALKSELVKLIPVNANKSPEIVVEGVQEGKVNYFIGNDSKKWKTDIPTYKAVVYKELYKGIDMKFYGNNRQMEYDIIVKPGADPSKVRLSYEGIKALSLTKEGDLEIALNEGKIIQKKPYVYQEIDGKRVAVEGKFKIISSTNFSYGFQVASYSKDHPLVIDPVLKYSTYLGGSGGDVVSGIAVDTSGNAYIAGATSSTDFPTVSPIQGSNAGSDDVFVTKINSSGTGLVYSTFLGGSGLDQGFNIAVDINGNAYITGRTISSDFPTASPIQGSNAGIYDAFVTKINSSGNVLLYSTYLGGTGSDWGSGISADASGNAYITGLTISGNFPTALPLQGSNAGSYDAFVTKINPSGTSFAYSTYLGGSGHDEGYAITTDDSGNAYFAGYTESTNFPIASPIQGSNAGGSDVFVTKMNPTGSSLVYSTYVGGTGSDDTSGIIAVDTSGNVYITGYTASANFPMVSPIQGTYAGGTNDAFVTKINSAGSAFVYSTYLGGSGDEHGSGIAVDASGNAYIGGYTNSTNFPVASAIQASNAGGYDAFVTKINPSGTGYVYSTYLGGSGSETFGYGFNTTVAADALGNAYVAGYTSSVDFPTASPIQGSNAGSGDVFIAKISPAVSGCVNLNGSPVVGSAVTLKQTAVPTQNTTTSSDGCYTFDTAVSGKSFTVTINGPVVP